MFVSGYGIWGLGVWFWVVGMRGSGLEFRVSGFRLQFLGFEVWVLGFVESNDGLQVSCVSDFLGRMGRWENLVIRVSGVGCVGAGRKLN